MDKEKLRVRIEEQVALEKKAHQHVEDLVLTDFNEKDVLQQVLNEIMPGHYADIVEERSIAKLCGYPLCSKKLIKVPHQKFHISIEKKKIYDISQRKLFCSNDCFKSSRYIESQLPTDPLWLRTEKVVFDFLETAHKKDDPSEERNLSQGNQTSMQDLESVNTEVDQEIVGCESSNRNDDEESTDCQDEDVVKEKIVESLSQIAIGKQTKLIDLPATNIHNPNNLDIDRLSRILEEWCTFETFMFFKSKPAKGEKDSHEKDGPSDSTENAKEKKHKSGKRFLEESSEWKSEITGNIKSENDSRYFISPLVDSKSQVNIRRRIVSQKLKHSFSEISAEMCISFYDFKFDLFPLLKTFKLTNQNISLKPNEWKVLATAILHAFSTQDTLLQDAIDKRVDKLETMLRKCGTDQDEFVKLVNLLNQKNQQGPRTNKHEIDNCEYDNDSLD